METPDRPRLRAHMRAAAMGIAIQLALAALIGVVAVVFIEDLHSDDHGSSSTAVLTTAQVATSA